MTPARGGNATL